MPPKIPNDQYADAVRKVAAKIVYDPKKGKTQIATKGRKGKTHFADGRTAITEDEKKAG